MSKFETDAPNATQTDAIQAPEGGLTKPEPLTLANIDVVFESALKKVDTDKDGTLDFSEMDAAATREDLTEPEKELFKILGDTRGSVAQLDKRVPYFGTTWISPEDIKALQQIGKDGASSWRTIGKQAFSNFVPTSLGSATSCSAYLLAVEGLAMSSALMVGSGVALAYTGLVGVVQARSYLTNDRANVEKILKQLEPK